MFKGLGAFLTVDSMFLLGGGGDTDIFVVEEGVASMKGRGVEVFISIFKVKVDSCFCL